MGLCRREDVTDGACASMKIPHGLPEGVLAAGKGLICKAVVPVDDEEDLLPALGPDKKIDKEALEQLRRRAADPVLNLILLHPRIGIACGKIPQGACKRQDHLTFCPRPGKSTLRQRQAPASGVRCERIQVSAKLATKSPDLPSSQQSSSSLVKCVFPKLRGRRKSGTSPPLSPRGSE